MTRTVTHSHRFPLFVSSNCPLRRHVYTHTHTHAHTCAHTHTDTSTCTRSHIPINTHFWSISQNSLHRQWHTLPNTGTLFLSAPVVCLVAVRSQTLPFIPRQRLFVSSEIMCLLTLLPVFTLRNSRRHHLTKVRVVCPQTPCHRLFLPRLAHTMHFCLASCTGYKQILLTLSRSPILSLHKIGSAMQKAATIDDCGSASVLDKMND